MAATPGPPSIFKATYSSVPVYEMPCKGVAVMKRRSDGWLNATQILKVAGFDKPQRTRVLEREVQKGTHEKVQGGYGKYQGTWIPVNRGIALAKQYGVLEPLQPIIDYVPPNGTSPPPAPKHITAAPKGPRQKKGTPASTAVATGGRGGTPASSQGGVIASSAAGLIHNQMQGGPLPPLPAPQTQTAHPQRAGRGTPRNNDQQQHQQIYATAPPLPVRGYDEQTNSPGPSDATSASRTPSPLGSEAPSEYSELYQQSGYGVPSSSQRKRKHDALNDDGMHMQQQAAQTQPPGSRASQGGPAVYARMILDYFVSESAQIPAFLISPPGDFDPNVVIDDDGHTALHWACAMGRIRIVKLLLTAGADIFRANAMGQTALMRSVMFTNNYDLRKFPELFELLHRSTINIDRNDRTVFHYVIDIAYQKGKAQAARYYLEVVLERLKEYPREVCDILNFQDEEGETALTLAARARSKNLVRILMNHGADTKITNRDGKSAEDYILEDERSRHGTIVDGGPGPSPLQQSHIPSPEQRQQQQQQQQQQLQQQHYTSPAQQALAAQQQGMMLMHDPNAPQGLQGHAAQQGVMYMVPNQPMTQQANGYYASDAASQPGIPPAHPTPQYQTALLAQVPLSAPQFHLSETGQRVSQHAVGQVQEHLETLAAAFDAELEDKERDIAQAHALLANIQAEVVESHKVAAGLRAHAGGLEEHKAREKQLQDELEDKMGKRFRLGWEKYVRDEEERQKPFIGIVKSTDKDGLPTHSISFTYPKTNGNGNGNGQEQKLPADLSSIFASPDPPEALASATKSAREQLLELKATRKELFESYVSLQAEAGAGEKINEYRKLIALGCGIQPQDVDNDLVRNLLDSLDNDEEHQLHPAVLPLQGQLQQRQQQQQQIQEIEESRA